MRINLLFLLAVLSACKSTELPVDGETDAGGNLPPGQVADGGGDTSLVVEAMAFLEVGADLSTVARDADGSFLALGSRAGTHRPFALRIRGGEITDESSTFPEVAWPECPRPGSGEAAALSISDAHSLAIFHGSCTDLDGRPLGGIPVIYEMRQDRVWRQLPPAELPLNATFFALDVTCEGGECHVLLNRSTSMVPSIDGSSSLTLLRRTASGWETELDEREDSDDYVFVPRQVARRGEQLLVLGERGTKTSYEFQGEIRHRASASSSWTSTTVANFVHAPHFIGNDPAFLQGKSIVKLEGGQTKTLRTYDDANDLVLFWAPFAGDLVAISERSQKPAGAVPAILSTLGLNAPAYHNPAHLAGVAFDDSTLLVVGAQSALKANGARKHAPLIMRISKTATGNDDGILANEERAQCSVPSDCANVEWQVKCQGRFSCNEATCVPTCDPVFSGGQCGNGTCDTAIGETRSSCAADCGG